jgi:hypothetical protein
LISAFKNSVKSQFAIGGSLNKAIEIFFMDQEGFFKKI